jgi:hypothetical protein
MTTQHGRKPVELFLEQLVVAHDRNLILSLSVNCPHVTITFHKETDAITIDKVVETIKKNYQSIHKMRIECHRHYASRHYHYVLNITLDK